MEPSSQTATEPAPGPPDHTQLPDEDGTFVHNFQEHPQSNLLTSSLLPRLQELHPDGQFCVGHDCGIYYQHTQPPLEGCKAPDWFYVPGVPPLLNGEVRRSFVFWQESGRPCLLIEFVSGDGSEERDRTPPRGKFWVYEQMIMAPYYAIFDAKQRTLELYRLVGGRYQLVPPNAAGRVPVDPLRVELGIWEGAYSGMNVPGLRAWDASTGKMLPSEEERTEAERQRAETAESLLDDTRHLLEEECERAEDERKRADDERKRNESLAAKLRALGVDPDAA
jgi:Uma2 family endonuclease